MPLKLVEPCPSRSAGIWLNSYIQLCAKDQLPKYKELQVLSSSDENKVDSAQDGFRNAAVQQHNAGAHQCNTTQVDKRHTQIHTSLPTAMPHHIPCMQLIAWPYECSVNSADKNYAPGLLPKWQWLGVSHCFQAVSIWETSVSFLELLVFSMVLTAI